jgi:hypothetical protein
MLERIVTPTLNPDQVQRLIRAQRRELEREFSRLGSMSDAGKLATALNELASVKAWEIVNNATMQRLTSALMTAKLLCSCCGLEFTAINGAKIGIGNYVCELCVPEMEEREREEIAEEANDDRLIDELKEARKAVA